MEENIKDKKIISDQLKKIIYELLHINISDDNANLFGADIRISPVTMVYLLLELEKAFSIKINDRFIEQLPQITINHLSDAIGMYSS